MIWNDLKPASGKSDTQMCWMSNGTKIHKISWKFTINKFCLFLTDASLMDISQHLQISQSRSTNYPPWGVCVCVHILHFFLTDNLDNLASAAISTQFQLSLLIPVGILGLWTIKMAFPDRAAETHSHCNGCVTKISFCSHLHVCLSQAPCPALLSLLDLHLFSVNQRLFVLIGSWTSISKKKIIWCKSIFHFERK